MMLKKSQKQENSPEKVINIGILKSPWGVFFPPEENTRTIEDALKLAKTYAEKIVESGFLYDMRIYDSAKMILDYVSKLEEDSNAVLVKMNNDSSKDGDISYSRESLDSKLVYKNLIKGETVTAIIGMEQNNEITNPDDKKESKYYI